MTNLPESNFKWRRIFSYATATSLLVLVGWIIWQIDDGSHLADIAFWLIIAHWWVVTYYMVAPSAEQIARIIQSARLFGKGEE